MVHYTHVYKVCLSKGHFKEDATLITDKTTQAASCSGKLQQRMTHSPGESSPGKRLAIPDPSGALAAAPAPALRISTGPRDTTSHGHPASLSLAPARGLCRPLRCCIRYQVHRSATEHRASRTLSGRKPEASRRPPNRYPAHHTPGPGQAASRRRCGAAFGTNSLQPHRQAPRSQAS